MKVEGNDGLEVIASSKYKYKLIPMDLHGKQQAFEAGEVEYVCYICMFFKQKSELVDPIAM